MGTDTYLNRPSTKFTTKKIFVDDFPILNKEYYKKFHKTIHIKEINYLKLFSTEFNVPRTEKELVSLGFETNYDWIFEFSNGDKFIIPNKSMKKYEETVPKIVVYMDEVGYMRKNYKNSFYKLEKTNPEIFKSFLFMNDISKISELRSHTKSKKEFDKYLMKNYLPGDLVRISY